MGFCQWWARWGLVGNSDTHLAYDMKGTTGRQMLFVDDELHEDFAGQFRCAFGPWCERHGGKRETFCCLWKSGFVDINWSLSFLLPAATMVMLYLLHFTESLCHEVLANFELDRWDVLQGWMEMAQARYAMGPARISQPLYSLKPYAASASVSVKSSPSSGAPETAGVQLNLYLWHNML